MADRPLTPHGELLESAREQVLQLSTREAARRAGISDTRWKQVVTGVAMRGGTTIPANATARTLVAMACAVNLDPTDVLTAAGTPASAESVAAMVEDLQRSRAPRPPVKSQSLVDEIERIKKMRQIPPADRIRMVNALVDLYEEQAAAAEG